MAAPALHVLPATFTEADGTKRKLRLKLRCFQLADLGWLVRSCGKDWWKEVAEGDLALAIKVLAHQLENAEELDIKGDAADYLQRHIKPGDSAQAIVTTLGELYENSMPEVVAAKKRRARMRALLRLLPAACCIAAAAFWAGWMA